MRTYLTLSALALMAIAMSLTGCAASANPDQLQQTGVKQMLPQETANKDLNFFFINGPMPGELTYSEGDKELAKFVSTAIAAGVATSSITDNEGASATNSGPPATYTQNVSMIIRSWGDSSQQAEVRADAQQHATTSQKVSNAMELLMQFQAALTAMMGGTAGQATEGSTASPTGGAQYLEARVDLMLDLMMDLAALAKEKEPAEEPADPNAPIE